MHDKKQRAKYEVGRPQANKDDEEIEVLHVEDNQRFADLCAEVLETNEDSFSVHNESRAAEALDHLEENEVDCIVSDYKLPGQNGIAFLETVRETYPELPFILFTGNGSEDIASEAISAGVTDYLQKKTGTEQYELLANRITNAVKKNRAEEKLQAIRERLSMFIEQSPLGILEYDSNLTIVGINDSGQEILGYSEEELRGETWEKLVTQNSYENVNDVTTALAEAEGGYHSIDENVRKDGERIICEWHNRTVTNDEGEVVGIFSLFDDVTDQKENEQQLRLFRRAIESSGHSIYVTDRDGTIKYVNQAFEEKTGYTADEAIGQTPAIVQSGVHDQEFYEELWETIVEGEVWRGEVINERKDGERYVIDQTISPVTGKTGAITHFVAVNNDITEQRATERELESRKQVTRVHNRILRHNLRNDLTVIDGYVSMLAAETDEASEYYSTIRDHIDRLDSLADQARVFDAAVENQYDVEQYPLGELLDTLVAKIESDYPAATFAQDVPEELTIEVRPPFKRALLEVMENAAEHGGTEPSITVSVEQVDGSTEISVADTGPGIPDIERVALESGLEDQLLHGEGLGHALVSWVVSNHDGSIETEVTDRGSTVTLRLPRQRHEVIERDGETVTLSPTIDRFKAVFETASDAIVLTNRHGRIIETNAAAGELFATEVEKLHGRHVTEFVPEDVWGAPLESDTEQSSADTSGEGPSVKAPVDANSEPTNNHGECQILRPDGSECIASYSLHSDLADGQQMIFLSDQTERVRYRERMRELYDTSRELQQVRDVDAVGEIVCDAIQNVLEFADGGLATYDEEHDGITPIGLTEGMDDIFGGEPGVFPAGSLPDRVLDREEEVVVEDISTMEFPEAETLPAASLIGIPLEENEAFLGVVDDSPGPVSDVTLDLARILALETDATLTRVRREQELKKAERRLSIALEAANAGVWEWDVQSETVVWNEAMERILGLETGSFEGTFDALLERVHPDDVGTLETNAEVALKDGGADQWKLRLAHEDGSYRWIDTRAQTVTDRDGTPSRMVGIGIDITDRRRRERKLQRRTRALERAPIGISIADPEQEDRPLIYVNEQFEKLTGYSRDDVVGRNCRFLQGEQTEPNQVRKMRAAIDNTEPATVELRNYRKDGTEFWNRVGIAPIFDESGDVTNWVGYQQDVTDRKERGREL